MTEPEAPDPSAGHSRLIQLLSDDLLARRARKGDRRAFEAIYRRYHQPLYRFCLMMVGNPQDAQDALQNTMVKALRALPGEKRHIRLKPWLYRIASNEAVEIMRSRRDNVAIEPERIQSTLEIAETVDSRERLRRLIADLAELPDRQRAALTMRELGGFGFEQIAKAFDTSSAVARQTVYEARLSLRQMEMGREMSCKKVMWELSEEDGRVTRRRDIQAHLRTCSECRAFRDAITKRRGELGALAPLPAALSAGLLESLLGGQASIAGGAGIGAAGSLGGTVGAGAGKAVATSAIVKSAATVAVVAAVGVSAANRGGVVDLPLTGGNGKTTKEASEPAASPAPHSDERGTVAAPDTVGGPSAKAGGEPNGARVVDGGAADSRGSTGGPEHDPGHASRGKRPETAGEQSRGNYRHGRPPAGYRGPPEGLPAASNRGQQTAAARKPPQANASPGRGGESRGQATPAPRPGRSPKTEGTAKAPPALPATPAEPPASAKSGGAAAKGPGSGEPEAPTP